MEPSSSDPKLIASFTAFCIAALGWFGTAYRLGRNQKSIESGLGERISLTEEKVRTIKAQQETNIKSLEKLTSIEVIVLQVKEKQTDYDATLKRIDTFLLTRDGEPRFITYPAHDVMSKNCRDTIISEINHILKDSTDMKEQWHQHSTEVRNDIKTIAESITKLTVSHAILSGRRVTDTHNQIGGE